MEIAVAIDALPEVTPGDELQESAGDTPPDAPLEAAEVAPPGEFSQEDRAALQAILDDYIRFSEDPGVAFAIHDGDRRWWSGTAGYAVVQSQTPVTADSLFRVGSNTKPMTAAWILLLVEEGLVELDEPVATYLPQYPQWKDITVRHLLGMRSGLPEFLNAPATIPTVLSDPTHDFSPAEVVDFIQDRPVDFAPGQGCTYSNTNYTLLGMIGEAVTGRRAADELKDRIFEPLGLKDTYLEMTGDPTDRLAHGYMDLAVLIPLMRLPPLIVGLFPEELFLGDTSVLDATTLLPPSLTWTAGAVVSRPDDLAVFQRALQSGKLLKPETMLEMRQFHLCNLLGGQVQYGLGVMMAPTAIGPLYGHGGLNFGFHVETYYSPDLDAAFSHMHNFLPAQVVTVTEQALAVALGGAGEIPAPCEVPADLFGSVPVDQPYLKLMLKGPVGSGAATDSASMASAWANLGDGWSRMYGVDRLGLYAAAVRKPVAGVDTLTLTAWGPSSSGTSHVRQLQFSLGAPVLDRVDAEGFVSLGMADLASAFPAIIDLELGDAAFQVRKACVVGAPDLARPSRLYFCDGPGSAAPGKMLRMAAAVGLTADQQTIEAYLSYSGRDRCTCFDDGGQPVACPAQ
jgi:D-alanyl-D-alanine carboxypeptidase